MPLRFCIDALQRARKQDISPDQVILLVRACSSPVPHRIGGVALSLSPDHADGMRGNTPKQRKKREGK